MPLRRRSPGSRFPSGPLLALSVACSFGCPQLLSDDFILLSERDPSEVDGGVGGPGPAPPPGGAGGPGGAPPSRPGVPTVVSVSPSNGASGVAADAVVTLTFSEPMDRRSVEAAYGSTELPANSVRFSWSVGDTVLQIKPNQLLGLATGTSPAATIARRYAFEIGASALDRGRDALPRFSSSFTTLREISQTLDALQDRTLTGNWRSDNVYGDNSCQFSDADGTMCVGDSTNGNVIYRGFVTFDLSALPAQSQLSSARLNLTIDSIRYSPFPDLGTLQAEQVSFDSISLDAFETAALGPLINVSSTGAASTALSADVLSSVQADLATRSRSQFRFRFSTDTDADGQGDLIEVLWNTQRLALTYLIP